MAKKPDPVPVDHTPRPPQQVLDQMAQAEALRAEMSGVPQQEEGQPPPQQEGQPPPQQEGQPPAQQPPAGEEPTWEQRARSLQGRYETLQKNYTQQGERINDLERVINTLKAQGAAPPPASDTPPQRPKFVTPEEETEYGADFLTVVGKRAKEEYFPEFDDLANRLKRLEGRVDGVGTVIEKTQVNDVYAGLNSQVPEWREVNKHPDFHAWLAEPDLFSGRIRKDMLQEAFSRHEGRRVVSFFRGFLEAAGSPPSREASEPTPYPNGDGTTGKRSLEEFAAPGRARSAPQNLPPEKPVYTSAWIAKFTADKIAGKYRGREADADAIEQDIYRAQHEGRIQ
jgi:hypothetical protein